MIVLALAGCVRPRANTATQPALLEVPPPPARVIVPPEPEEPVEEATTVEPETIARHPSAPRPRPPRERPETAKPAEAKPEAPPDAEPRPADVPPVALGPLQPQLPASPGEMDRRVRDQLSQARSTLERVDYRQLGADAKSQYDTAKRFIEQASQALTDKNLLFAAKLAEKAVGLASNLPR